MPHESAAALDGICYHPDTMTVSAIPPKIRRPLGFAWIVMVVLGLLVAAGNVLFE